MSVQKTSDLIWQDSQHQVLFQLIDELRSNDIDISVFQRLNDYATNHFALEEEYMAKVGYPKMQAHVQAHNKFRVELESMLNMQESCDQMMRDVVATFLTEWLRLHVFGIDKDLEDFILASEYK